MEQAMNDNDNGDKGGESYRVHPSVRVIASKTGLDVRNTIGEHRPGTLEAHEAEVSQVIEAVELVRSNGSLSIGKCTGMDIHVRFK